MTKAKVLREKAAKLMEEADRIEASQLQKIGRLTVKFLGGDGEVDLEKFRTEVEKIQGGKR